jgi:hypothetical protein
MEKGGGHHAMTTTEPLMDWRGMGNTWRSLGLLMLLPALLAAGLMDTSPLENNLPEPDAYRLPFSESILESQEWRAPEKPERDWRLPPPPEPGWRTPNAPRSKSSSSNKTLELFPRHRSGQPSDYDIIERDEKPLIKLFEFGTK